MAEGLHWRQGHGIDPFREWGRRELPGPKDGKRSGLVWVDLDGAIRRYGPAFGLDDSGDLLLYEKKENSGKLTYGEAFVYKWLAVAIASSEKAERWRGNHLIRVTYMVPPPTCHECGQPLMNADAAYDLFRTATLQLDDHEISHEELRAFLVGEAT